MILRALLPTTLFIALPFAAEGNDAARAAAEAKQALSVSAPESDTSVEAQLRSFELAEGYRIELFADETDGIANPVAMRFDSQGRLWVLCTLAYPQILPTATANDGLYILEDRDGDGRADHSQVFADGLDMPMGFALGDGGVYLGMGQDLLFLKDTDGDDRADHREVVATGFGTGDTHQNINSFSWSPDGELLFCQGLHAFSRIETPWGIERLDEHGVWRLQPRRRHFDAFRGGSGQNPWGIAFGLWGEPFAKGNSPAISELLPVMVPTDHFQRPLDIGQTQTKSMILEIVDSPALPADLQGQALIAGYFARNIERLSLTAEGSGHRMENQPHLLRTDHRSFRPVDLRVGPDGALYVADWFNPIIGHYQASFRHPDRDLKHGRIWRITATDGRRLETFDLTRLTSTELLERLSDSPLREKERIRAELSNRNSDEVLTSVAEWVADPGDADLERVRFEALSLSAWHEQVDPPLLEALFSAEEPLARAFATRIVGRWQDRLEQPLTLLDQAISDPSPRVRLEAVVACGQFSDPKAMTVAARALEKPMDRFLQAALVQTAHALKPHWWPALTQGELRFASPDQLSFVLRESAGEEALRVVRDLLNTSSLEPSSRGSLLELLVSIGTPQDLATALREAEQHPRVLSALATDHQVRKRLPAGDWVSSLRTHLEASELERRIPALRLAGLWKAEALFDLVQPRVSDPTVDPKERAAAVQAMARLRPATSAAELRRLIVEDDSPVVRAAAMGALTEVDLPLAATAAAEQLRNPPTDQPIDDWITPFLKVSDGPKALAEGLAKEPLSTDQAEPVLSVLAAAGRFDADLDRVLRPSTSTDQVGMPTHSEAYVAQLTDEVERLGDAEQGKQVYHQASLSCAACHQIAGSGGVLGPDLSAVGAGLPIELLVEALLWPDRQVKEGYLATHLTTKTGQTVAGYIETEDRRQMVIRDAATGTRQTLALSDIQQRQDAGTLMPPGLTAALTRSQLRDLIRYLHELRGE